MRTYSMGDNNATINHNTNEVNAIESVKVFYFCFNEINDQIDRLPWEVAFQVWLNEYDGFLMSCSRDGLWTIKQPCLPSAQPMKIDYLKDLLQLPQSLTRTLLTLWATRCMAPNFHIYILSILGLYKKGKKGWKKEKRQLVWTETEGRF